MSKPLVVSRFRSFKTITKALWKRDKYVVDVCETSDSESGVEIPSEIFVVTNCDNQRRSVSQSRLTTTSSIVIGETPHHDSLTTSERMQQMGMNAGHPKQKLPNENSSSDVRDSEMRKSTVPEKECAINILHQNSTNKDAVIDALLLKIEQLTEVQRKRSKVVSDLNALVAKLIRQLAAKDEQHRLMDQTLDGQINTMQAQDESNRKLETFISSNMHLTAQLLFLKGANEYVSRLLSEKEMALEEARSTIAALMEGTSSTTQEVSAQQIELKSDWSVETVPHSNKGVALDEEEKNTENKD